MDKSTNTVNKFILVFIVIQPIMDILTTFTLSFPISVGSLLRTLFMSVLFITLFICFSHKNKKKNFTLMIMAFSGVLVSFIINLLLKSHFNWIWELNFYLKVSYFLVIIFAVLYVNERNCVSTRTLYTATTITSYIVGCTYWMAVLTNTSINSYRYDTSGYSGWFFSANELSAITLILFGVMSIQLIQKKQLAHWFAYIIILSMLPMIGTKTAFIGGLVLISITIAYILWKLRLKIWRDWHAIAFIMIIFLFACFIPYTSIGNNSPPENHVSPTQNELKANSELEALSTYELLSQKILSSRDIYFAEIKKDYLHAHILRKIFGLGYAGDYQNEPKLIEMDFFDLFFSLGIIGSLFAMLPLIFLVKHLIFKKPYFEIKYLLLFTIVGLSVGIAFLAGHVLFAPSAMTYLSIPLMLIGGHKNEQTQTS
ncbi:O-antigen ligase family protein [Virgibacillus pantothenticus]|uniref:O-antigen ligase family protein n=1 Tax=Virgibacillus pantothenticus TaxID=1473 RepID=UPI001BCE385E|nr:O-antigen ligase family protein [Virgibacillus pantothenticus]